MSNRTAKSELALVGVLVLMASACALVGGLGVVNYLSGNSLRAVASLGMPAFLAYWAWQVRDNIHGEPLIKLFSVAWVAGLPIGAASFAVRQFFA
jgi:hypothetical protein